MSLILSDLRFGLRMLARSPGFTSVAVLALALGVGANTTIFSVVDAILLRPLPYHDANQLVAVWEKSPEGLDRSAVSPRSFLEWRRRSNSFGALAALHILPVNVTGTGKPEEVWSLRVSPELFPMLGMKALHGRTLLPGDENAPFVVLSHRYWKRRFGSRESVVGNTLSVNEVNATIIGVMPAEFELPPLLGSQAEIFTPLSLTEWEITNAGRFLSVIGRLKNGTGIAQTQAEMSAVARGLEHDIPSRNAGWGVHLVTLREQLVGDVRPAILILLAAVGLVLLIACANVANLLLARASGRRREISIRTALGAGHSRIVRQLLTESLTLGLIGGAAGLILAFWGIQVIGLLRDRLGIPRVELIRMNVEVLGFALLLSLGTGIIFGLVPALSAWRSDLIPALKSGGRTSGAGHGNRLRSAFVVLEISLALILLAGAGLLFRTFQSLQRVDVGFRPAGVLSMRVMVTPPRYITPPSRIVFYDKVLDRLRTLPGVDSAAAINFIPLCGIRTWTTFTIMGRPAPELGSRPVADVRTITPDYFRVMGIPLVGGRAFTNRDEKSAPAVFIVSQSLAKHMWPEGENPLGARIQARVVVGSGEGEVVGIAGDVRHRGLRSEPEYALYLPYPQFPLPFASFVLRGAGDPVRLASAAERAIQAIDPEQPVSELRTMDDVVAASFSETRLSMSLLISLAAMAMLLSAVGIFGVMSYTVTQRTQEIGVRMALGAGRGDILRLIVGHALGLTALGIVIGLAGALMLAKVVSSFLFGVKVNDPATLASVSVLLFAVAFFSAYIPARRASKVDPTVALRYE